MRALQVAKASLFAVVGLYVTITTTALYGPLIGALTVAITAGFIWETIREK